MKLVVAEKPSVAMNIAGVLGARHRKDGYVEGSGYIVSWCIGHLVGLSEPDAYGIDKKWSFSQLPIIPDKWKLTIMPSTKDQYKVLTSLMKNSDVDEIICATDAGREGELIFRYVYKLSKSDKPVKRLWVSSMEEEAIRDGFNNLLPDSKYDNLYQAGYARSRADWLVGMNGTRLFTLRYNTFLSLGRVQTPTLAEIVKREEDINNFVEKPFYMVGIKHCDTILGFSKRFDEKEEALKVKNDCDHKTAVVKSVDKSVKKQNPPKLFDLTSLQRQANKFFGYTAQQTLDCAQSLYEKKYTTYPRTDSQYITTDMKDTVTELFNKLLKQYSETGLSFEPDVKRVTNNKKVTDHHAIIPTKEVLRKDISNINEAERNVLNLIIHRFICAMGQPHKDEVTTVTLDVEGNEFTGKGNKIIDIGFTDAENKLSAYFWNIKPKSGEKELPSMSVGQKFEDIRAGTKEGKTTPPKHFTEDTLLAFMETAGNDFYDEDSDAEKKGIGTPATRASIIEKLIVKKYIRREKKSLIPTETGISLIKVVPKELKSPKLTADWEMKLKQIETGSISSQDFMEDIQGFVIRLVAEYGERAADANPGFSGSGNSEILGKCPECGSEVVNGKYGAYCKAKCGMLVGRARGNNLTSNQVSKLLSGKKVTISVSGRKYEVLPETQPFSYQNKDGNLIEGCGWVTNFVFTKKNPKG